MTARNKILTIMGIIILIGVTARFGIRAVPYFGVDRTYGISGMKSLTLFRYALKDLLRKANIGYTSPAVENDGE